MRRFISVLLASLMAALPLSGAGLANAAGGPTVGVDYNIANYANSPLPVVKQGGLFGQPTITGGMRKFVDRLPGLTATGANNLGQYLPKAIPDTIKYPGSDYYEIELGEYTEKMHSDLPPTKLRGYRQTNTTNATVSKFHYLGPVIIAKKGTPVRIKFTNRLPIGASGDLFLPVDTTIMGAGLGPDGMNSYTQNRATLHLHGGFTPWISDGTPHQWTAPAGENTPYKKGVSTRDVPDMGLPQDGSITFYWSNVASGRLMFYHDHAAGITRLNVYGGEAAGYLLVDPAERALTTGMPEFPLVIQDKTFVPDPAQLAATDPLWDTNKWGGKGSLWYPHVYMPIQDPNSPNGLSPMGRWHYGPYFWPVFPAVDGPPPIVSAVSEAYLDTPVVNGTAYPYIEVDPKEYRFRILNASNERYLNLQLYQSTSIIDRIDVISGGSGYTFEPTVTITDARGKGAAAKAIVDLNPNSPTYSKVRKIELLAVGSNYAGATVAISGGGGRGALARAHTYTKPTEVGMVPATPNSPAGITGINWPADWSADTRDGRHGGLPDPAFAGPAWIHIGNEGGIQQQPALLNNIPTGYNTNKGAATVMNVTDHTLYLSPAERADVIVDFSKYAGKTLILYNDMGAPNPAVDPRYDYYTGNQDMTDSGGAPSTLAGYGSNTRTIMQIRVNRAIGVKTYPAVSYRPGPTNAYNPNTLARLQTELPNAFASTQPAPFVNPGVYADIQQRTITAADGTVMPLLQKGLTDELFDTHGRQMAQLGVELPLSTAWIQTSVPFFYPDPPTELLKDGEIQIWRITHAGVDTHAIHFHHLRVQLINRVGFDNTIYPPDPTELGWKDTIKMSPLTEIIVAVRDEQIENLPWELPNSVRLLDPFRPEGSTAGFSQWDPNNQNAAIANHLINYGAEYVWHCHMLAHEENDMMRSIAIAYKPAVPAGLIAVVTGQNVVLSWIDASINETDWIVQRSTDGVRWNNIATAPSVTGDSKNTVVTFTDTTASPVTTYSYRVVASNVVGDTVATDGGWPTVANDSIPSAIASVTVN